MNLPILRPALAAIVLTAASLLPASAGIVRFNATINAAQETTASNSPATGTAVLLYDATANRFDLVITLTNFANTIADSHIHEAAPGVAGDVFEPLGPETNGFYVRDGATVTATYTNIEYSGSAENLLTGGAYLNFHTIAFPAGEIRGQLIPEPVKLAAVLTPDQEVTGANPPVVSDAYGAAQAIYDPATKMITTIGFIYNFTNTLSDSHIHEAAAGANGPVRTGFGGAANYLQSGNTYTQIFADRAWAGAAASPVSERAYYNVHSNPGYPAGEIRGQFRVVDPSSPGRLGNVSARGQVGTNDGVLIAGIIVTGDHPVRVVLRGRGPILGPLGVTGALANPVLSVYDGPSRLLFSIDDHAAAPFADLLTASGLRPTEAAEAAVMLILPPGPFTAVISGADNSTGIALAEAFEVVDW